LRLFGPGGGVALEFVTEIVIVAVVVVAQVQNSATVLHCSAVRLETENEITVDGDQLLSDISTVPEFERMRLVMAFEVSEAL
jgi:hypothetical protein